MSLNLLTVTNFPQCLKSPKFLLISSDDLNNSNSFINQFIQVISKAQMQPMALDSVDSSTKSAVKGNQTFGIFLNQSYTNYSLVQIKYGINLKNLKERNLFRCLDLMTDLDQYFDEQNNYQFNFTKFKVSLINELKDFFKLDGQENFEHTQTYKVILLDDITTFLSLNVDLTDLAAFVIYLKHFCLLNGISLIVQNFLDSNKLPFSLERFDTFLNNLSDIVIQTRQLETGYSNKVDGSLEIKNYVTNTNQMYLFKSTERQLKLFAPGTVQL